MQSHTSDGPARVLPTDHRRAARRSELGIRRSAAGFVAFVAFVVLGCYEGHDWGDDTSAGDAETDTRDDDLDDRPGDGTTDGGADDGTDDAPDDDPDDDPDDAPDDDPDADPDDPDNDSGPASADPDAAIVDFRIRPGTGSSRWNAPDETLTAYVGQTLRLINDDSVPHTLHTFGVPVEHGDPIPPGGSADAVLAEPYDAGDSTPELWDHDAGEPAYFWLRVIPRDDG